MEPSLGEIIQLHMDRSNLINPITSSATQLIETPVTVQNISNDENIKDDNTYGSNNTATNLPRSQPYEATLILPTVTQLGLEINLDKELSFLHTSSILSTETNNVTDSKTSVTDIVPTIETTSFTHENNTATTMTLSMLPNLSIRSQTISSSITIPPFTTSFSLMTSSLSTTTTATASVAYPESTATTKGSQSLLVSDQLLSPDHSILYDFLPQEDTFSITLNDISILRSSETTDRASTDRQLPKSEVESNRVQLTDFLQTFGLTSSLNEPIDLVKSLVKSNENETYGSLFLDDLGSKSQKFLDTSTTQTAVCTISTASTTTSTSPAKAKSHVTTTLSEISKTHDSLFSHFNANVSRFSVGAEPIHIASLDQWSSSSSESTTGVIIRSDLIPNTSATCHHSVPCINSINPMLQHSLTCPNASKSIPFEQITNYLHPSEGDVRSSNYKPEHKQVNSGKGITSHSNVPAKSKHYKHLQSHEHVCSHGHHLSSSIPSGIHLTELEESILSTSQHVHNMMPTENVKRIHGKHSDGKKFEQVRRNKHLHHLHEQMNQESSGNNNLVSNDLENAAEILEEVPYVVLRRPRSVDVKQYQLHLEHQRQQAAVLAAAAGGYPFHLYQTPGAHYPFTSRLPIGSQLSYGHYVQPPPFHGFRSLECNQNHHLDAPITFGSHRQSEQSGKQASHKFPSSHSKQVSKRDSDSCKRHSKRTHSRSRKETEPFAFDEKSDKKFSHYDATTNHITATNLPPQTTSAYPHHRHHDHCLHRRSEVLSSGKTNGVSGDRKVKSSTLASTVTTISTATNVSSKDQKYDKSNIEHDEDLARGRETIIPSVLSSGVVTTTTSATGLTKQKSQLPELQQLQPSSPMQEKKTKATLSMMTIESQKLKQISSPDSREENGESEIPYPVSVSAVKPVPKLKATSKSTSKRQTHEHLQHPIPPPYWHYHHNEAQRQQYHQHHPACASLIGKHDATTRSTKDQPQPTIYGSEFLATNYPHIFTKVLKPSGSGKSEPRVTSTKKKVTSKPSGLSGDQMKPAVMYDFTENNKESDEKISKQTKKSSSKPYSDERFRGDMDPNETFEKLREDLRSAGFTVDTNRPYLSTTKSKNNKQPTDGYVQEPKKAGDKTHSQSKPKQIDVTNDRVVFPNYSKLITSSTTSTTTTTSTTVAAGSVPSESTKSNAVEEIELATSTGKVNISNLIPTYDSMSGLHPRTPIYLDSESEEEMITNVRGMSVEETVQVPDTKDSQVCKKQVEEWIEKSQAVYNAEEVSKDTDTQALRKEDKQHTEINSAVDLGHEHNVETKPHMANRKHDRSDELSDDKSTTSSSKSLEKISLDENDLLKSNLEYSPTMISADKLSDVKNSQKELLSNLKLQERKLKQELAKHRALTEKLVKVKRFNEKLLTMGKSKENNVVCDATEREDDNTAENIYNKDSIDEVHSKITSSELNDESTDVQGTTQEPHIKSSPTIETDINKESTETMGDRLESSSSHKRKDVQHQEGQKHRSKYEANYKHHHDHRRHKHSGHHESNETTTGNQKTTKELNEMPKSDQLEIDQSSLSTSYKEEEPSITDNLLIITNKAAIEYQYGEQSLIYEQSDVTKLSTLITTASSTLIMTESEQQIYQSTHPTPSHSIEPNIAKCNLEVISEKQDNDQSSSSQHLSNDEEKQLAIKNQSSSVYENLNISENKHIEESQSIQLTGDKANELPPIPPTCPPPIDYILSHVTDRTDESSDLMVKQAIDLLDEVVAKSTQIDDNDGQGRLLSSVNKCLEYSSSEQVMLDDDKEFDGTRIPNILDNNENLFDTVATADNSAYGDRTMQIVGETNKNDVSNRPYSPCESTTSASEGSEDIEPFPPPPSAEVLAEVIEEETGPNIEVVEEEEEEEENDEDDDCEENRRKSSSVSTVIEVSLPITASVSTTQNFDDNETTKNKPEFSNEEIRDNPLIVDKPKEDDTVISESVKSIMDAESSIVSSAQTNQTADCGELTTEESSSTNKNLEVSSPSE
ncbi:hypothetical protein Smp_135190 [Schistosoma mansoni]|uniref:hypothetical protein n=1 Tax=Schistosoma mansoni TaxID=6183 RepID=UPI0001A632E8|nr:hypothetical protein Smp_135190 [Schistosoma mansoni]|eukprot:XP_018655075.1 hypothetical protein Smp_135190 [Schistosoma mansoni]